MAETAQPETAAESEVASDELTLDGAAEAFKNFDNPVAERPRAPDGKFVSTQPQEAEQIEAEDEEQSEPEAESHDEGETEEAAEEAQPEAVDLPTSWPAEQAEMWQSLPPEAQRIISEREGQRDAAVNAKFQEAANLRKAHEAEISEAQTNRQRFAEAADFVLGLVQPTRPPASMLDQRSSDYNPDEYHRLDRAYQEQVSVIQSVAQQRQQIAQQEQQARDAEAAQFRNAVEEKYGPLLLKDAPELADPQKQGPAMAELVRYAIDNGVPEETFTDEERRKGITSADLRFAWKAMQYDKMMTAKQQVKPKAATPAAPPVRPGVATPKSAVEAAQRKKAIERLDRSGSIEDAAAIFKTAFKR
jgi:hypothetical protein